MVNKQEEIKFTVWGVLPVTKSEVTLRSSWWKSFYRIILFLTITYFYSNFSLRCRRLIKVSWCHTFTITNVCLILFLLKVTSIQFLLIISPQIHSFKSREKEKWSITKGALDCFTNSPCQHLKKHIENSMENMQTDVGCKGVRSKSG